MARQLLPVPVLLLAEYTLRHSAEQPSATAEEREIDASLITPGNAAALFLRQVFAVALAG